MSDFITLSCPNCGGKLEVSKKAPSLVCQHCGMEHYIRQETDNILLESFARCPVCKRNDKAEKVSVIVVNQSPSIALRLSPPHSPSTPSNYARYWFPVSVFLGGVIAGLILDNIDVSQTLIFIVGVVITGVVVAFAFQIIKIKRNELKEKYSIERPKWKQAMQRWKRLYYCSRDGVVYDPQTGETCEPDLLKEFLYRQ